MDINRPSDWGNIVIDIIDQNKSNTDFPNPEDFKTTEDEVKDYIYDKQRILDRSEERGKNLLVPGILLVMPAIILSGFGEGVKILLIGVLAGVLLTFFYFVIAKLIDKRQLAKMRNNDIEAYINKLTDIYRL